MNKNEFRNFLLETAPHATIRMQKKVNRNAEYICFSSLEESENMISAGCYIEDLYEAYRSANDDSSGRLVVRDIISDRLGGLTSAANELLPLLPGNTGIIMFELINTAANKAFLETVPHREIFDLSLIYRMLLSATADTDSPGSSFVISNNYAEQVLGMT